jgi:hypothetical protein
VPVAWTICSILSQGKLGQDARLIYVGYGSLAVVGKPVSDVRFTPESGHLRRSD